MAPKKQSEDDLLLESRIHSNQLQYPKGVLRYIAAAVAFQPIYFSHTLQLMEWTDKINIGIFAVVGILTAYMLHEAYVVMIASEFWGRQRHFTEVKDNDERALKRIRLQRAMGYALFFINTVFFFLDSLLLTCFLHQMEPRAKHIISPLLSAALLWVIALKNEESRQKRLRQHR
eukprot:gene278-151_t